MSDLQHLFGELRNAHRAGVAELHSVVQDSTERLSDPDYRQALLDEIGELVSTSAPTVMLTDLGVLSDEPLFTGVWRRLGAQFAPAPDLQFQSLDDGIDHATSAAIAAIEHEQLVGWIEALAADGPPWTDRSTVASAIVILATRVAGAGLETRILERLPSLVAWGSPFVLLSRVADDFAEQYMREGHAEHVMRTRECVDRCLIQVADFRIRKQELGTTLHLSSASLRMLQQLRRLRLLVLMTHDERAQALAELVQTIARARSRRFPTVHFLDEKLELVAYLAVGHAARKGEKYAVRERDEYWGFWRKSIFGGLIVALFGSAKLLLEVEGLAIAPQAAVYALNYALCFVLIYVLGASLATKQPAFTASRLAESLEEGPDHESFAELVRAIWRSQSVSLLGNIAGAAVCSLGLILVAAELSGQPFIDGAKAQYLLGKMHPWESGSIWFAAVAGVMLSLAGFFAGFVDNAIVFHRVADRVRMRRGVFRVLPSFAAEWLAERIDNKTGAMASNLLLGVLLGSAGAVGLILGLPFDIRHVAFASSHTAISLFYLGEASWRVFVTAALGVGLIGFVNFIVSFGLTLLVAVQARRVSGADWRSGFRNVAALFREDPMGFLLPKPPEPQPQVTTSGNGSK